MSTNLAKLAVPLADNCLQRFMFENVIRFVCEISFEAWMAESLIISIDLIILFVELLILEPAVKVGHNTTQETPCWSINVLFLEMYKRPTIIPSFVFTAGE